jgi:hypothetical protein
MFIIYSFLTYFIIRFFKKKIVIGECPSKGFKASVYSILGIIFFGSFVLFYIYDFYIYKAEFGLNDLVQILVGLILGILMSVIEEKVFFKKIRK